jgi:hypothetical protein
MEKKTKMTKLTEPIECKKITTIEDEAPDDILICCGSPEERCKGVIERLSPSYRSKLIFFLRYTNHKSEKRENNIQEMKKRLKAVGEIRDKPMDENKPIPILREVVEEIAKYTQNNDKPKITIDISTIIKWHLLILLKGLNSTKKNGTLRFLYTEPEDYITDLFQPLSFGIHSIFPIPVYSGIFDFSKNSLLVLMLGYEGDRAMALYEAMDPTECLLLIAKPSYHEEWEGRAEEMNREIINTVGASKIRYIHSRDPLAVSLQLHELLSDKKYSEYNHIISPLGTKPQALGLYMYLSTNPSNTVLIYGSPARSNELFYSKGIGRSWVLQYL